MERRRISLISGLLCSATFFLDNFCALHIFRLSEQQKPFQGLGLPKGFQMIQQFDQFQKYGQDNVNAAVKTLGAMSKAAQAIAVETADYAKKSFEQSTATFEKLAGAGSLDKAIEIQTDYLKTSYEGFVAQSSKVGELFTNLAKEAFKPYEDIVAKPAKMK
jgi:hypothetical protein